VTIVYLVAFGWPVALAIVAAIVEGIARVADAIAGRPPP
jgi:hypothetical protein